MLMDDIERYVALRRSLGFKLKKPSRHLRSFARFAAERGEHHIHAATAVAWAAAAPTPEARHRWLGYVVRLARFLRAEDPAHEIPPAFRHAEIAASSLYLRAGRTGADP
jgi:hypothetical protein